MHIVHKQTRTLFPLNHHNLQRPPPPTASLLPTTTTSRNRSTFNHRQYPLRTTTTTMWQRHVTSPIDKGRQRTITDGNDLPRQRECIRFDGVETTWHVNGRGTSTDVARQRTWHVVQTVTTTRVVTVHVNSGEPLLPLTFAHENDDDDPETTPPPAKDDHNQPPPPINDAQHPSQATTTTTARPPVNDHPPPSTGHKRRRPLTDERCSPSPTNHNTRDPPPAKTATAAHE